MVDEILDGLARLSALILVSLINSILHLGGSCHLCDPMGYEAGNPRQLNDTTVN